MIELSRPVLPFRRNRRRPWAALAAACLLLPAFGQDADLAESDREQMDPFEKHSLAKADKVFNEKQFRAAAAQYDSFLIEFPQSRVRAYVVFRKARATDLDNKRFEAIRKYKEVLDYFPDSSHAAAALYFIGECHMDTGDPDNAVKAWSEMTQDKDYRKHPLAATALNKLAENAWKTKSFETGLACYEQVVADFRTANPNAAEQAMNKVIEYRMLTEPDEPRLRAFYVKAEGFNAAPQTIKDDPATLPAYWAFIRYRIRHQYGPSLQADAPRQKFHRYWSDAMEGKCPDNDDFQIDYIDFRFIEENDLTRRAKRLDAQFEKYQKPGDYARIVRWLGLYKGNKAKLNEYYSKLDLAKMSQPGVEQLVFALLNQQEYAMALNAFDKLLFQNMTDAARENFSRRLWEYVRAGFSVTAMERIANSFTDKDYGAMTLLRYYAWIQNAKDGIPIGERLKSNPKFSTEALTIMGTLYVASRQYEKAISCYQQAENPPDTSFKIADCYNRLGKLDAAVSTLREVENFFAKVAPPAAMTIAGYYNQAGLTNKYIAELRAVMKKYRGSSESSTAHEELEKKGFKTGGGVDSE
jgi:TolA-binding protein